MDALLIEADGVLKRQLAGFERAHRLIQAAERLLEGQRIGRAALAAGGITGADGGESAVLAAAPAAVCSGHARLSSHPAVCARRARAWPPMALHRPSL